MSVGSVLPNISFLQEAMCGSVEKLAGDFLLGLMFSSAVISPTIIHIFCLNRLVEFGSRYVEFQGLILFYFPFNR